MYSIFIIMNNQQTQGIWVKIFNVNQIIHSQRKNENANLIDFELPESFFGYDKNKKFYFYWRHANYLYRSPYNNNLSKINPAQSEKMILIENNSIKWQLMSKAERDNVIPKIIPQSQRYSNEIEIPQNPFLANQNGITLGQRLQNSIKLEPFNSLNDKFLIFKKLEMQAVIALIEADWETLYLDCKNDTKLYCEALISVLNAQNYYEKSYSLEIQSDIKALQNHLSANSINRFHFRKSNEQKITITIGQVYRFIASLINNEIVTFGGVPPINIPLLPNEVSNKFVGTNDQGTVAEVTNGNLSAQGQIIFELLHIIYTTPNISIEQLQGAASLDSFFNFIFRCVNQQADEEDRLIIHNYVAAISAQENLTDEMANQAFYARLSSINMVTIINKIYTIESILNNSNITEENKRSELTEKIRTKDDFLNTLNYLPIERISLIFVYFKIKNLIASKNDFLYILNLLQQNKKSFFSKETVALLSEWPWQTSLSIYVIICPYLNNQQKNLAFNILKLKICENIRSDEDLIVVFSNLTYQESLHIYKVIVNKLLGDTLELSSNCSNENTTNEIKRFLSLTNNQTFMFLLYLKKIFVNKVEMVMDIQFLTEPDKAVMKISFITLEQLNDFRNKIIKFGCVAPYVENELSIYLSPNGVRRMVDGLGLSKAGHSRYKKLKDDFKNEYNACSAKQKACRLFVDHKEHFKMNDIVIVRDFYHQASYIKFKLYDNNESIHFHEYLVANDIMDHKVIECAVFASYEQAKIIFKSVSSKGINLLDNYLTEAGFKVNYWYNSRFSIFSGPVKVEVIPVDNMVDNHSIELQ